MVIPKELIETHHLPFSKFSMAETIRLSCAIVFILTLTLWVFDVVKWLPFAHAWASRAIYGVAIVSILATGVLFFRADTNLERMPFEGVWKSTTEFPDGKDDNTKRIEHNEVIITYDQNENTYRGQSDTGWANHSSFKILSMDPKAERCRLSVTSGTISSEREFDVSIQRNNRRLILRDESAIFATLEN